MKVLANDGISSSGINQLEKSGFEVITEKVDQPDLIKFINNQKIEVILVRSATQVRKDIIDYCHPLKLLEEVELGWIILMLPMLKKKVLKSSIHLLHLLNQLLN